MLEKIERWIVLGSADRAVAVFTKVIKNTLKAIDRLEAYSSILQDKIDRDQAATYRRSDTERFKLANAIDKNQKFIDDIQAELKRARTFLEKFDE